MLIMARMIFIPVVAGISLMQFDIHLLQCVLHVLNMFGRIRNKHDSLSQISPELAGLRIRTKRALQQAEGVELLEPPAIH